MKTSFSGFSIIMEMMGFELGIFIYAFTVLSTFIYIAASFCEAPLRLLPKSVIDDIEEKLRT